MKYQWAQVGIKKKPIFSDIITELIQSGINEIATTIKTNPRTDIMNNQKKKKSVDYSLHFLHQITYHNASRGTDTMVGNIENNNQILNDMMEMTNQQHIYAHKCVCAYQKYSKLRLTILAFRNISRSISSYDPVCVLCSVSCSSSTSTVLCDHVCICGLMGPCTCILMEGWI